VKVVYVSYDGALDPLGTSQVVRYLVGLSAKGVRYSLISFEKPALWEDDARREGLRERLAKAGVHWRPLVYHRRPRVPATLWDCWTGARAISAEVIRLDADIVHCRGDVAMAMARAARLPRRTRLLYDVRSFFADERAESGSWPAGGLLDRAVRRIEAGNRVAAHGIVVVSEMARRILSAALPMTPIRVIPGCADLSLFHPEGAGSAPEYGIVYCGSLGTWYMTEPIVAFARSASRRFGRALLLTPQIDEARRAGANGDWAEVRSVPGDEVPAWLRRARAAMFFIRPTPAKRTSFPVKLAEALATGLPVVTNRGIGDLDDLIEAERVGVFVKDFSPEAYDEACQRLTELLEDPTTRQRCRSLAEKRYGLEWALDAYRHVYSSLSPRDTATDSA
jgi:glycosyltransferase involved in cell wall biosynthesis